MNKQQLQALSDAELNAEVAKVLYPKALDIKSEINGKACITVFDPDWDDFHKYRDYMNNYNDIMSEAFERKLSIRFDGYYGENVWIVETDNYDYKATRGRILAAHKNPLRAICIVICLMESNK